MASAITRLQQDALDRKVAVSDLLRRALVVARRLELHEFEEWIEKELHGYGDSPDIPPYRVVTGQAMALNPRRGWVLAGFRRERDRKYYSYRKSGQSIAELESLLVERRRGPLQMPFPCPVTLDFGGLTVETSVSLFVSEAAIAGIIDTVRTIVLNWSLKLKDEGVLGEALSFSASEREAAHRSPQQITNFYGSVQSAQIQQGAGQTVQISVAGTPDIAALRDFVAALRAASPALGLDADAQAEVEAQARTLEAQLDAPRPRPSILREGLHSIRAVLEGAAGGAAAQLLLQLGKLLTGN